MRTVKTTFTGNRRANYTRRARSRAHALVCVLLGLLSVAASADNVVLNDGSPTLSGRLLKAPDWPRGKVALLLHGTLSHRDTEIIESLETLLGDEGVSTLAINLSLGVEARDAAFDCSEEHRHREEDASAELARWTAWLNDQGVQDLTLFGHSRGANQLARYLLAADGAAAQRLVLIAPPRWAGTSATESGYAARHGEALAPLRDLARQMVDAGEGETLLPAPVGLLYCTDARVSAESFLSYYRPDPLRDTPALLARIELPTLVIAGSRDTIAAGLPDAFDGSLAHVRVEEIDGADHFFRDLYADELVEIAVEFMHEND